MSEQNSADKRSVSTDALATLGTVIDSKQKRDAIHLAVIPVIACERMAPGTHVVLDGEHAFADRKLPGRPAIGIVDPFLASPVEGGQRFWLVIYPRVITSLRHVWTHPEISDELAKEKPLVEATDDIQCYDGDGVKYVPPEPPKPLNAKDSEAWLRQFCATHDAPSYEVMLIAIQGGQIDKNYDHCTNDGEYVTVMGQDAHCDIPPEFWDHVAVVTGGKKIPRARHFSCSC